MLKKIIIGLVVALGIIVIYAAFQPADYTISRETTVEVSAEKIFPYINDAKKMDSWNPWSDFDPKAKMTFSGPNAGVGAKTSWEGGDKLGTGSATVIESIPNSIVKTKLEYSKPFTMVQIAEISLTPSGSSTVVKWSVSGTNDLLGRVMCVLMNPDKMVGGMFEKGLQKLKTLLESSNQ